MIKGVNNFRGLNLPRQISRRQATNGLRILTGKGTTVIVTITSVTESDLGSYTCKAVSGTLSSAPSAAVKVTGLGKFV
jgi:hypothetical protein